MTTQPRVPASDEQDNQAGEPGRRSHSGGPPPSRARVVVVGGGVIGTSVAYHLAQAGVRDVLLLERDRLTSGTTWHAAGLMTTFGSTSQTSIELRTYTRDLYARLEAETGLATGLKQVGLIELAIEPGRLEEYRRVSVFNRHLGIDVHEISPREVAELWPLARTDDVLAGFYLPDDGRVNPVDVTMSLARGARMAGATLIEGLPVTGFLTRRGAVAGVRTPEGDVEAEYVVNCAGMWARQVGELAGVSIPLQAAEHYYLLTEPIPGVDSSWPVLEDPASYGYYREEGGGLMLDAAVDYYAVAGAHLPALAFGLKADMALRDVDKLMMRVAVAGADPAFGKLMAHEHQVRVEGQHLAL